MGYYKKIIIYNTINTNYKSLHWQVIYLHERWLTSVKTLSPPQAETWRFRGQNKEKDGNEDCHCGICHISERRRDGGINKLNYLKVTFKQIFDV